MIALLTATEESFDSAVTPIFNDLIDRAKAAGKEPVEFLIGPDIAACYIAETTIVSPPIAAIIMTQGFSGIEYNAIPLVPVIFFGVALTTKPATQAA